MVGGSIDIIAKAKRVLSPAEFREWMDGLRHHIPSLMDFIPQVSTNLVSPKHLKAITDAIEAAKNGGIKLVISAPPQHGKSIVVTHGLIWLLLQQAKRHAYISYSAQRSAEVSLETRWLAERAGLAYDGNLDLCRTPDGGSIRWTGIGGTLTGAPVDGLLIVDDPVKNMEEARSATVRDGTDSWFRSVALVRTHPGASCIVIATRWNEDDLSGRLIKRGWDSINLPAINPTGKALWESQRPLTWLQNRRKEIGELEWSALYQGQPVPAGGHVFAEPATYTTLPSGMRFAIGVDLAYSTRSASDWSVAVVMGEFDCKWYVVDVVRKQVQATEFINDLKRLQSKYQAAPARIYGFGTEHGAIQFFQREGVRISIMPPKGDKLSRAQPVAARWNDGTVQLPASAPWLRDLLDEVQGFTGTNADAHDDQVDALGTAFDLLPSRTISKPDPKLRLMELSPDEERMFQRSIREQRQDRERDAY